MRTDTVRVLSSVTMAKIGGGLPDTAQSPYPSAVPTCAVGCNYETDFCQGQ